MILADTSIWIGHLRGIEPGLASLLEGGRVLIHPAVLGEVALGNLRQRAVILTTLADLPQATAASDAEVMAMIEHRALHGRGIGWVDAHLLASVMLTTGSALWSRDRRLVGAGKAIGVRVSDFG